MTKALNIADKAMFGALLVLVFFIPYSSVMMQVGLCGMYLAWLSKCFLLWKSDGRQGIIKSIRFPSPEVWWPLLFLGIFILVTLPWSHMPALTLKKFFSRFLQQIFLMFLVTEIINTPQRLYITMGTLLGTLIFVGADIFIQFFQGHSFIFKSEMLIGQRVTGPLRHCNDLGTLLVVILPIVLALFATRKTWMHFILNRRWMPFAATVCAFLFIWLVISLGLTSSRGAWIAFAITFFAWSVYLRNNKLILTTVLLLMVFFSVFGFRCFMLRSDIGSQKGSPTVLFLNPSSRFIYWHTAEQVIARYPMIGCGYNTYIQTLKELNLHPQEYPHNSLFHITAEMGIIGLLTYFWFWGSLFLKGFQTLKEISLNRDLLMLGSAIYFGLIAWWIHSLTDTAWESLPLSILWWFMAGLLLSLGTVSQQVKLKEV
jgi:O-antigen ligase